jgi:pimeloyl-ACP methyl ester carboxylesterase
MDILEKASSDFVAPAGTFACALPGAFTRAVATNTNTATDVATEPDFMDDDALLATLTASTSARVEFAKLPALERPGFALLKYVLRMVAFFSPSLAAHLCLRVVRFPPKVRPKAAHLELISSAKKFELNIAGCRACGYSWGSGPAVIFCHGWGADAGWFAPYVSALNERGFQVVAFDAPGHGMSARVHTDMYDFAACIGAAADWVLTSGGQLQAVVGHSVGGVAAALAMRDWNIACDRLALISAFTDCNWVADAFIRMTGLPQNVGKRMNDQCANRRRGLFALGRTSIVDMIRHAPAHVFLAHDKDDADIPFWHSLVLLDGCRRAQFYRTAGCGHRRVLRNSGLVAALVKFVSD